MDQARLLITAMAVKCRNTIEDWHAREPDLPKPLQPSHLEWMCDMIERHADDWPSNKLHRWIGFVQSAMIANRMLDLDGAKALFDKAKVAYAETDEDLSDFDIGGEG
jgi:hypothetical protein